MSERISIDATRRPRSLQASMNRLAIAILLACISIETALAEPASAPSPNQTGRVDLDAYYAFPGSAAAYYQPLSGVNSKALAAFDINELSGELRLSIPGVPTLQALARGGLISLTDLSSQALQDWTHSHVFLGLGMGYTKRLTREFELGADAFLGGSQSYFSALTLEGQPKTMGQLNLVLGAAGRFALNPSYNVSVSVHPTLRYIAGLGILKDFDAFCFGVGFSAAYRFGQDPDTAGSTIRAIRLEDTRLPPVFAAMRSYYASKPIGTLSITNNERYAIRGLSISFMQAGFMDSPTPVAAIGTLEAGESVSVPIVATFNDSVFTTEGITPLTGEIISDYEARGRRVEQRHSITYELHDKNAIVWDDDRKISAFITPQDGAIRNYASYIRQAHKGSLNPYISSNLQFAMQAFNALCELGIIYQIDPTSPFTTVQDQATIVDSVSLPRETIVRRTGDCDDLTALYCTLLECVGINTALITVPGHIYCAFDSGIAPADYQTLYPDRTMTIESGGTLWVPVEITMIGTGSFMEAWETAVEEWRGAANIPEERGFHMVKDAQALYRAISLRETDLGLQYGDEEPLVARFASDLSSLKAAILGPFKEESKRAKTASTQVALGLVAARIGDFSQARLAFETAIGIDQDHMNAYINLGTLYLLMERPKDAIAILEKAERRIASASLRVSRTSQFKLAINLGKAYFELKRLDLAKAQWIRAQEIDPVAASEFSFLGESE